MAPRSVAAVICAGRRGARDEHLALVAEAVPGLERPGPPERSGEVGPARPVGAVLTCAAMPAKACMPRWKSDAVGDPRRRQRDDEDGDDRRDRLGEHVARRLRQLVRRAAQAPRDGEEEHGDDGGERERQRPVERVERVEPDEGRRARLGPHVGDGQPEDRHRAEDRRGDEQPVPGLAAHRDAQVDEPGHRADDPGDEDAEPVADGGAQAADEALVVPRAAAAGSGPSR